MRERLHKERGEMATKFVVKEKRKSKWKERDV